MAKKGKYAAVLPKLPKFPLVEPERRDVVEAVKQEILAADEFQVELSLDALLDQFSSILGIVVRRQKGVTGGRQHASEFAKAYAELRKINDILDFWKSSIGLLIEAYTALMVEQFEIEGISGVKLENGQPVNTYSEPYAQVTDKEAFRLWCIKQGLETQLALPWQTTNALTKARLLEGESEPDGVTCFSKTKVRLGSE